MQFEVNGTTYFLNFVPDDDKWYLLSPTKQGFKQVPVVDADTAPFFGPMIFADEEQGTIIN
ncbi:MAG TPA: hypothetical protein VN622_16750 [Clostridia bacterium]|nr:hypothetical protein [Clostridia bacterium]